jgi:dynein light chain roadblock-type
MSEIEDIVKRIHSHKGMKGLIIVNSEGIPIRDTFDEADRLLTIQYAALITQMATKSRAAIKELDSTNDLSFLRIRSKKHEILVAPDRDYILIVIQDPTCE